MFSLVEMLIANGAALHTLPVLRLMEVVAEDVLVSKEQTALVQFALGRVLDSLNLAGPAKEAFGRATGRAGRLSPSDREEQGAEMMRTRAVQQDGEFGGGGDDTPAPSRPLSARDGLLSTGGGGGGGASGGGGGNLQGAALRALPAKHERRLVNKRAPIHDLWIRQADDLLSTGEVAAAKECVLYCGHRAYVYLLCSCPQPSLSLYIAVPLP
jgi:hypothetical protein